MARRASEAAMRSVVTTGVLGFGEGGGGGLLSLFSGLDRPPGGARLQHLDGQDVTRLAHPSRGQRQPPDRVLRGRGERLDGGGWFWSNSVWPGGSRHHPRVGRVQTSSTDGL
jgi:hypothetical protein